MQLVGTGGNAFAILGKAQRALRDADVGADQIQHFIDEAQSGDYDHLLATCMEWFDAE